MLTFRSTLTAVLCTCVGLLGAASVPTATAPGATAAGPSAAVATESPRTGPRVVVVSGDVRRPRLLTPRTLSRFEQQTVTTSFTAGGVPTTRTFTGPLLLDVVLSAGPRIDPDVSNDALRFVVRATATDRYQAVVSWGEIDPGFEGKQVLLALTEDGEVLDRPRLVVPGDARGGRYVTDVIGLRVFDLGGR